MLIGLLPTLYFYLTILYICFVVGASYLCVFVDSRSILYVLDHYCVCAELGIPMVMYYVYDNG